MSNLNVLASLVGLVALSICGHANAVNYSLNFNQTGALQPYSDPTYAGIIASFNYLATGNRQFPSINLSAGDVITTTFQFSNIVTILPGTATSGFKNTYDFSFRPASGSSPGSTTGYYSQVISFSTNGVVVSTPAPFFQYSGCGGCFSMGGYSNSLTPFSFDKAVISLTIASGSAFLVGGAASYAQFTGLQSLAPVPEPTTVALMLLGIVSLGLLTGSPRVRHQPQ